MNEDQHDASFVKLNSIDLPRHIDFRKGPATGIGNHNAYLEAILEQQHSQLWTEVDKRPPWKIIVSQISDDTPFFNVVFAYHHAIGDGVSGVIFHRSLLDALNHPSVASKAPDRLLKTPDSIHLVPAIEDLVDFRISWNYLLRVAWNAYKRTWSKSLGIKAPPPWPANKINKELAEKYRSRVKIMAVSPEQVANLVGKCREEKATLTGLLHGIAVSLLSLRVPEATTFALTTPTSLRHLLSTPPTQDMAVQAGSHTVTYTQTQLADIRSSSQDPVKTASKIWSIARDFKAKIGSSLSVGDNPVGLNRYVTDLFEHYKANASLPRDESLVISNLGNFSIKGEDIWGIEQLSFSQSGMVLGAAFDFNLVSVDGGPLTIATTWLQGVVEDSVVLDMAERIEIVLNSIRCGREGIVLP